MTPIIFDNTLRIMPESSSSRHSALSQSSPSQTALGQSALGQPLPRHLYPGAPRLFVFKRCSSQRNTLLSAGSEIRQVVGMDDRLLHVIRQFLGVVADHAQQFLGVIIDLAAADDLTTRTD